MFKRNIFFLIITILGIVAPLLIPIPYEIMDIWGQYIILLLPSILFVILTKESFKEIFKLRKINLKTLVITLVMSIAMQPLTILAASFGNMIASDQAQMLENWMPQYSPLMGLFVIALTPAICEEAVIRGVMLPTNSKMSIHKLALLNGFLFGIFHMNLYQFTYTFVMAVIVTYLVIATKSILPSVIIHFINNGLSVLSESNTGINSFFTVLEEGPKFIQNNEIASFVYLILMAIISFVVVRCLIKKTMKINSYEPKSITARSTEDETIKSKFKFKDYLPLGLSTVLFVFISSMY
ncbi:type II CAAX endopeptidase family protein [Clostridium sediminicola]|uniref:CPBP family intramembrane glutamic endopeptidase n=1 Tax=Clostridium sediminicola TaxID=3114879 RepID=UPI0031F1D1E9